MDLKPSRHHSASSCYSPQLDHALQVIAAALSAACWLAYHGDIAWHDGQPLWRWRLAIRETASEPALRTERDPQVGTSQAIGEDWPHQLYPGACQRLAEEVQRSQAAAHELVLGSEAVSDSLGLHRLAWLVIRPSGLTRGPLQPNGLTQASRLTQLDERSECFVCDCFEFVRDESSAGYSHSDQRVLSVLAQEFILPLLSCDEVEEDGRALDQIGVALSRRQREVLAGLVAGQSVKEVASHLNLSPHTVNDYVKAIYRHFDVCSRGELLAVVHGRMRHARRSETT